MLAILIEGNRPDVLNAVRAENGRILTEVARTGTLRVAFDVSDEAGLLAVRDRLRAAGIDASVPAVPAPG